jgi:hypothetical protein
VIGFVKAVAVVVVLLTNSEVAAVSNPLRRGGSKVSDALAVSFDNHIGHDYIGDADARFDWYHTKEKRYPFDLNFFNKITKGGVPSKTLNIALAGTGVGKSLFMCHSASNFLNQGQNVLYITLEMAEERIAERIDANLMDVTIDDLHDLPKELYDNKMTKLRSKTSGQLIIKEYPTASAHAGHFKAYVLVLDLKVVIYHLISISRQSLKN